MVKPSDVSNTVLKYYSYLFYTIVITAYIGIGYKAPQAMVTFNYYLKVLIGIFLVYRFNSYRKHIKFEEFDRRVAFSAGMFILSTTILSRYFSVFKHADTPAVDDVVIKNENTKDKNKTNDDDVKNKNKME